MRKRLSINAATAVKKIKEKVSKGEKVNLGKIMVESGYSSYTSKQPTDKLLQQKGVREALEEAGITSDFLAGVHKDLFFAETIQKAIFEKLINTDNDLIVKMIESVNGCRVLFINNSKNQIEVVYAMPEWMIRKVAVELGYKITDAISPNKTFVLGRVDHHLEYPTEERRKYLDEILRDNS
jgi:hypothetical protein